VKCFKCGVDSKLKERTEHKGRCKSCGHPFTFDPKASPDLPFNDSFFAKTLSALSVNDTLYFTPKQFYYFLNARLAAKKGDPLAFAGGCLTVLAVVGFVIMLAVGFKGFGAFFLFLLMLLALGGGVTLLLPGVRKRLRQGKPKPLPVTPEQFKAWEAKWAQVNGAPPKLLAPPKPALEPARVSEEVAAYSFDRVVVCEHATVAQFLIANNFHFEHNCAVLAVNRYPQNLFETVMTMLRRNPELKVYALHDASPHGAQLVYRLTTDERWFAGGGAQIFDLGLLPRQLLERSAFVQTSAQSATEAKLLPDAVRASLLPEEVKWLEEGKYVELESLSPQLLLRVITQGIARSRDPRYEDALVPVSYGDGPGGVYVYSADSFG
jgi:hypothetical protein